MGFSTGKWEGRTLVIETTMLLPGWLDGSGYPMTGGDGTRIVERWTPAADGLTMERTMTVTDKAYTQPIVRTGSSGFVPWTGSDLRFRRLFTLRSRLVASRSPRGQARSVV